VKSLIAGARKAFLAAVAGGDKAKVDESYRAFASVLDRSAKKGIIAKNNASRRKARAAAFMLASASA
jgi:ribosomal protein S20